MKWLKRLFGKAELKPLEETPLERPADWNLTIDDLFEEMKAGKRKYVGSPESDWAKEYELSLMPDGTRFPKQGDVYESNLDQRISFMTSWSAPFTGSGEAMLFEGERVWISSAPVGEMSTVCYALPVEYKKLEERMVPRLERESRSFSGFHFCLKTIILNQEFTLIQTGFEGAIDSISGANTKALDG